KEAARSNRTVKGEESEYKLDEAAVGRGGYAQVFRATDIADNKVYACKVVDQLTREFTLIEKENIASEIALLKTLKHDNIVLFKDVSQQQQYMTYIFMEFVDGITLHDHYHNCNNYFTELEARNIFQQVCEAIQYLHSKDIVHRDIKSENIMLTNDLKVKLIDFGLARHSNTPNVLSTYCGTPFYMAPETSLGDGENGYSKPVDVWALGVMLFRMLVGSYPFGKVQDATSTAKVEAIPAETPAETPAAIPENPTNQTEAEKPRTESEEPKTELNERRYSAYDRDWQKLLNKNVPRSQEGVNVYLGKERAISSVHCLIHREGGTVFVSNADTHNGTYVNNMKVENRRAVQLFDGDELGIIVPPENREESTRYAVSYRLSLRYKVTIFGVLKTRDEDLVRRKYIDFTFEPPVAKIRNLSISSPSPSSSPSTSPSPKRRRANLPPPNPELIWGTLHPVNANTEKRDLIEPRISIGRGNDCDIHITYNFISRCHCVIEWVEDDKRAYLSGIGRAGTTVNGIEVDTPEPYQLRHNDEICLDRVAKNITKAQVTKEDSNGKSSSAEGITSEGPSAT
ncbi:hypothetical protein BGX26_003900, partial [Mortierella sp. AD094]